MKLVHWPLMGGLLHFVQRGGDWARPQPAQAPPWCIPNVTVHPSMAKKGKSKGKSIYIAIIFVVHARRSGMDHTVLPATTPMPAFTS